MLMCANGVRQINKDPPLLESPETLTGMVALEFRPQALECYGAPVHYVNQSVVSKENV